MESISKDTITYYWKSFADRFNDNKLGIVEVKEWSNLEGYDIKFESGNKDLNHAISVSDTQMEVLLQILKQIEKENEESSN